MSMDLSSRPETAREYPPSSAAVSRQADGDARLRLQAAEIIAAVLSDSTPGQAHAREQLWQCVQAHPDRPEIALVEHLIALREEAGGGGSPDLFLVPEQAEGSETPAQPSRPGSAGRPGQRSGARQPILHQRPTLRVHYGRADRGGRGGLGGMATDGI